MSGRLRLGWVVYEEIGIAITDPSRIAKITIEGEYVPRLGPSRVLWYRPRMIDLADLIAMRDAGKTFDEIWGSPEDEWLHYPGDERHHWSERRGLHGL